MKSSDFSKALLVGVAVTIPIIAGIIFDQLGIGLAICFGAFWSSPSNTKGSFRHKKLGILFSAALVTIVSFIGAYLNFDTWLLLPVLGVLTFAIAYISIYGFRASLISFSGLLALVLGFAHTPTELAPYQYSLLIGVGGLWYLLLVAIAYRLNPRAQTMELFSETFELTSKFLETRANLIDELPDRKELLKTLHSLQTELIEHHESLRDILITSRKSSGNSNYQNKQLLIFVQLVEILEMAVANPVDYYSLDTLFKNHTTLKEDFKSIILAISEQLINYSNPSLKFKEKGLEHIDTLLKIAATDVKELNTKEKYEQFIILQNLLEYQEKQFDKLKQIQWLLSNPRLQSSDYLTTESLKKFIIPQDYDFKLWIQNFTLKSTIFKHSLRLSVVMMTGYILGILLEFQNPYWILLTIIVIMRPSYGLTRSRSKDRIIGTLIGAVVAVGIVLYLKDTYVLGGLAMVALIVAFSMVQKNYKASATFVTLSVIFIYAILRPDIFVVIQYRILDTLIGAILSIMAIKWLWPAWGFLGIRDNISSSVSANCIFFKCITGVYIDKTTISTEYKVARKTAFLETSNLNAAFQQMAQEPKSKQKKIDTIYEIVVLTHTMLSSLASLSSYLQHNQTTPASGKFKKSVNIIDSQLAVILENLDQVTTGVEDEKPIDFNSFDEHALSNFSFSDVEKMIGEASGDYRDFQEAHLVWEQLRWMYATNKKLIGLTTLLGSRD